MKIEYTENIPEELEDIIYEGFETYAKKNNLEVNYKRFAFVIKDEKNEIFGGLIGTAMYKSIHIEDFFIKDSLRGQGYGFTILSEVENFFKDKGYNHMNLGTYEFQAPKFYQKYGFEIEFIRKNKENSKLNKYFLIKRFEK